MKPPASRFPSDLSREPNYLRDKFRKEIRRLKEEAAKPRAVVVAEIKPKAAK